MGFSAICLFDATFPSRLIPAAPGGSLMNPEDEKLSLDKYKLSHLAELVSPHPEACVFAMSSR
jgi:hypothetical protein